VARLHLYRCIVDIDNGYVEHHSGRRETLTTMERRLLAYAKRISSEHAELWCLCWRALAHLVAGNSRPAEEVLELARKGPNPWVRRDVGIRTLIREIDRRTS
jgi:hypothetical protein